MANTKTLGMSANILALVSGALLVVALLVPGVVIEEMCSYHTEGCRQEYSSWFVILVHSGPAGISVLAPLVLWSVAAVPGIVFGWWRRVWALVVLLLAVLLALSCVLLLLQGQNTWALGITMVLSCGLAMIGAVFHVRREAPRLRTAS